MEPESQSLPRRNAFQSINAFELQAHNFESFQKPRSKIRFYFPMHLPTEMRGGMRLGAGLRRAGFDYDDMRRALHLHPDTRVWASVKGEAAGGRELRRVWDAAGDAAPSRAVSAGELKRPLFRELPPAPSFPIEALGALREAAEAMQATTQAPLAICAQSALAAATLAIQAHRDVELPGAGRRPLTALFVSVAESGERKSSVDRLALRPVHILEEELRSGDKDARASYRNACDARAES